MELEDVLQPKVTIKVEEDGVGSASLKVPIYEDDIHSGLKHWLQKIDVVLEPKVTIKVEEDEVSDVKGCYIWLSENTQSNLLEETVTQPKKRKCVVVNCPNSFCRRTIHEEPFLSFHRFPQDEKTREVWIKLCKVDKSSTNNCYVCSNHFTTEDYTKNISVVQGRRYNRLRPGVIPSVDLPGDDVEPSSSESSLKPSGSITLDGKTDLLDEGDNITQDALMSLNGLMKETLTTQLINSAKGRGTCLGKLSRRKNGQNNMEQFSQLRYQGLKHTSEVISPSSVEKTTENELRKLEAKHQRLVKEKELDLLKQKYQVLEKCFQELKVKSNEEIERLNGIIKGKEEEYNNELREVLSVFLKAEEIEAVVEQTSW